MCRTLSCALGGSYKLHEHFCRKLGLDPQAHGPQTTKDGKFTVEFVECLASCGTAPVMMCNDSFYEGVTRAKGGPDPGRMQVKPQMSTPQSHTANREWGWLPDMDLNHDKQIQSLLCYRYTIGQTGARTKVKFPRRSQVATNMPQEYRHILKYADQPGYTPDIECYLRHGGYEVLQKSAGAPAQNACPTGGPSAAPNNSARRSGSPGLRGRGGAGFSCGLKWSFVDRKSGKPIYLICNADESEPGTFKDKQILHKDPHQMLEGMIIACYANDVHLAYIYIRGEFVEGAKILNRALEEARGKNLLGKNILGSGYDLGDPRPSRRGRLHLRRGNRADRVAGRQARLSADQAALLSRRAGAVHVPDDRQQRRNALRGKAHRRHGRRRIRQARHAQQHRHAHRQHQRACEEAGVLRSRGRQGHHRANSSMIPCFGGGLRDGRKLKAVIPGGSSAKVFKAGEKFKLKRKGPDGKDTEQEVEMLDLPYDFDSLIAAGSMSGSGAIIVMDDSTDIVEALANMSEFYAHESCGQCTPCREGSLWMAKALHRLTHGQGRKADADYLVRIADNIPGGRTICAFGEACSWPVQSFVGKFKDEFVARGAADEERRAANETSTVSRPEVTHV